MTTSERAASRDTQSVVASNPFWYHTMEVAPGVVTPGWFDLRPVVDKMPWPDVRGKRCLDIGTWDGFLAFELERRGASEVVATDLADHELWDWPAHLRERGVDYLKTASGPEKGKGLRLAIELSGSSVQPAEVNVYDLSPETLGEFDVIVCGSLLLHLRDPMRALAAIRGVCREAFLSTNQIDLALTVLGRRKSLAQLHSAGEMCQWWVPNPRAHRHMIESVGFKVVRQSRPYAIPFGVSHRRLPPTPRRLMTAAARRVIAGNDGVPHHAALAHPTG